LSFWVWLLYRSLERSFKVSEIFVNFMYRVIMT